MNKDLTILTNRSGMNIHDPSVALLASSIADLQWNNDHGEDNCIVFRRGADGGEMRVLELFSDGSVTYSHYAGPNFEKCLSESYAGGLNVGDICRRFKFLHDGDLEALSRCSWKKSRSRIRQLAGRYTG
jgi:hypothetical protein